MLSPRTLTLLVALVAWSVAEGARGEELLRVGVIGCDTSHAVAFTALINEDDATGDLARVQVVAAFPGGSPDLPASRDRVVGYTHQLQAMGVEIVDSIEQLVERCDAVLLESVDGRVHLEQFRRAAVGKPVFIDKPAAASLADLLAIFRIADETGTPCFSSSALRYCDAVRELKSDVALGPIVGCETTTPYSTDPTHPDLYWYAIHGVESLFALMGPGCQNASCIETDSAAVVVGRWSDGRLGVMRGIKTGKADYTFTVFGEKDLAHRRGFSGYEPLVRNIAAFFVSRQPPVTREETIEMFAFMEAAHESRRRDGRPVSLSEMLAGAKEGGGEAGP